jgi:glycosyltransferase involved in cell wall biosynthesis
MSASKHTTSIVFIFPAQYSNNYQVGFLQKYQELKATFDDLGFKTDFLKHFGTFRSLYKAIINSREYDIVWIRCPGRRLWFVTLFLLRIRKPKIFIEMPDPFKGYWSNLARISFKNKLINIIELLLSTILMPILAYRSLGIIEYANENRILSYFLLLKKKGIILSNLIPREIIKFVKYQPKICETTIERKKLTLVSVATFAPWHGIDRVIVGMGFYRRNNNSVDVRLRLIGEIEPNQKAELIELAKEHLVDEKISFIGPLKAIDLPESLVECDIGIGSIGIHRTGHLVDSSLKNGLYCGTGIPHIASVKDTRFDQDFKFRYMINYDDSAVDINSLIQWFNKIDLHVAPRLMHKYYESSLSSKILIYPVIAKIDKSAYNNLH